MEGRITYLILGAYLTQVCNMKYIHGVGRDVRLIDMITGFFDVLLTGLLDDWRKPRLMGNSVLTLCDEF